MSAALVHAAPVAQAHHERLARHVDRLPAVAELLAGDSDEALRTALDEACDFLTGLLVPHMAAAERALYPELERMLQNRHSMTPMRREHGQIRAAVAELERLRGRSEGVALSMGERITLRRVILRLYGLLKTHLAEELLYAHIVEHGASADAERALAAAMEHGGSGRFD